ncbi:lipase maturation factor 1 isoform X2 [Erinaceus europaeus]|uniref:Lipase maturation factor n=1 Tax=Erinaceus europaeus TaxID=9365 RepID=A0ABM3VWG4_ERIEU|nr:lipase maturation factor 1 isoform X2 [Erinaceus europaeus]
MRTDGQVMAAPGEQLRRRKAGVTDVGPGASPAREHDPAGCPARLHPGTFWLTRVVLLRALAFVYSVAFLVAFWQNKQLIGDRGLLPCRLYLRRLRQHFRGRVGWDAVSAAPTLLWLLDWSHMDANLDALALLGLALSSFVLLSGCANMLLMAILWVLYTSLVNVGQAWLGVTAAGDGLSGHLPLPAVDTVTPAPLDTHLPDRPVGLQVADFQDHAWRGPHQDPGGPMLVGPDLHGLPLREPPSTHRGTALPCSGSQRQWRWAPCPPEAGASARCTAVTGTNCISATHLVNSGVSSPQVLAGGQTQPVPNPAAYFLHQSPWWVHRFETLSNHFLELVVPFFIFLGRRMCALHGALQLLFQAILILSGNLSFLNWLTMVPSFACFDDATLGFLFPSGPGGLKARVLQLQEDSVHGAQPPPKRSCVVRRVVHLALGLLLAWLSVPVVVNLLSPSQVMNTSFHPLRIVNTYGAFGSITRERTEVVLQGTASPNASAPDAEWQEYEFKCKPGGLWRRPCLLSPYHHRLDWLMWFAAFQTYEQNEWILHLAGKLLANDAEAASLLALNPFAGRPPPRWLRGEHFRYKFSRLAGRHASDGKWWIRKRIGPYFPPVGLQDLRDYFRERGWPLPQPDSGAWAAEK